MPRAIVFPAVGNETALAPISAAEALMELAPNVLLTEPARRRRIWTRSASSRARTPCYRLSTGRDLDRAAAAVRALLEG